MSEMTPEDRKSFDDSMLYGWQMEHSWPYIEDVIEMLADRGYEIRRKPDWVDPKQAATTQYLADAEVWMVWDGGEKRLPYERTQTALTVHPEWNAGMSNAVLEVREGDKVISRTTITILP